MLFQQTYMPGTFSSDRFYIQSHSRQKPQQQQEQEQEQEQQQQQQQQQPPQYSQDTLTRLRSHSDIDPTRRPCNQQHVHQEQVSYVYPQRVVVSSNQDQELPPAPQLLNSNYSSALSQYQQMYQQYYQEQSQQPAQPQYLPSIMVPPQSPTLASYYFEGSNGWVKHYYDPKRRQYLSSRVEPQYHRHQQQHQQQHQHQHQHQNIAAAAAAAAAPTSSSQLPQLDSLGLNQHQLQMAIQQQQQLIQQTSLKSSQPPHVYQYLGYDFNQLSSSNQYLPTSSLLHPLINAECTEEWRETLLQYAHTLYSTNPRNTMLVWILQVLHNAYPMHIPTLLLLACVYYTYQDYPSSLRYNQLILTQDPNYVEAMSNIGTTLRSMGRTSDAEQWWYKAVKLRPGYWDAVENLVGVLCSTSTDLQKQQQHQHREGASNDKDPKRTQGYPRYQEALAVCEFVEKYFYKTESAMGPIKAPKQLPAHQLPRLQNLFYAKGNLKYALGDITGARQEYEKGLELVFGGTNLVAVANHIALACGSTAVMEATRYGKILEPSALPIVLLQPEQAVRIVQIAFPQSGGIFPGLVGLTPSAGGNESRSALQQATQTTSTIMLTLAKLFQDMMNPSTPAVAAAAVAATASAGGKGPPAMSLLLPLYYISLALHPSASTANNLGIILSNISGASATMAVKMTNAQQPQQPVTGTMLAMQYYMYGLQLDPRHPHLYTNLGSLLKDMGHLNEAVCMYEKAVEYNPQFDVALANLGNAIKDMGRVQDSVQWYKRAVEVNPNFVDAVCGLVNSLGGVCDWRGRGGVGDEPTVDQYGNFYPSAGDKNARSGWISRVVEIVEKQLDEGIVWGAGILKTRIDRQGNSLGERLIERLLQTNGLSKNDSVQLRQHWSKRLAHYSDTQVNQKNEGGWMIRLIERIIRRLQHKWYIEQYGKAVTSGTPRSAIIVTKEAAHCFQRPLIPSNLSAPPVPTVLPFHTFTYPLNARQVRLISHRNALRISHCTLTSSWVANHVYPPPPPPSPRIKIGYVSSDFNNHPLAHLMQSVFGFHDKSKFEVFCYATTASDNSVYRQKIERESEHFVDISTWSNQQVVDRIVVDKIHVLVNLNGYTKGARNEIFAARPSPVQCSFMGFAGTLGGGWCDWIIADPIVCPPEMVSCEIWRKRRQQEGLFIKEAGDFEGDVDPEEDTNDFVYTEKFIYMPHSYFVNDHKQGFREESEEPMPNMSENDLETLWTIEQDKRWTMRQEVFPTIPHDVVVFANFNQLYKLEPSTFRMWLRILERVPHSILWLLRFPPAGEQHLRRSAVEWAGAQVANRVIFTDVAPKHVHIHRGRVADIFLDTPECNAHTTAADILWSGTPIVTYPKYMHKMCSRVGASIAKASGFGKEMVVETEQEYEERAVSLALGLKYTINDQSKRRGHGEAMELRKKLFCTRESSRLFDTCRWTRNLERGYAEAWRRWVTAQEFEDVHPDTTVGCIWVTDPDD